MISSIIDSQRNVTIGLGRRIAAVLLILGPLAACSNGTPLSAALTGNRTLNIARTALAGGNPQMALTVTNAVLKSNPDDSEALIDRGDAYYLLSDCVSATADFRHALRVSPRTATAELGLGRCALPTDPRTAADDFNDATRDAPGNAVAFNDLGIARADQSEFSAAQAAFRSALAIDPSMQAASVNLGMSLALGGNPAQAEIVLGPLARDPGATPLIRADYATALALAGHPKAANRILIADMPAAEADAMIAQILRLRALPAVKEAAG
ncbi:tetratricopeptide repeat protein [Acidiphilium sp. PA]|uniref:tetratricopeptide repeat protein n=1 Tax=Acidiphilium sp. PA TaxID=2871705 RepID=UPI0022440DC8|nr:tetratricopeptide repeat protein [Acidiphilium sp. PA]MCW8307218.1 tetratricopeptide repeat protein [Acidiphilium sp. PA]